MKFSNLMLIAITGLFGVSCSWFGAGERGNDYRRSAELPAIDVPESLDSEVVGELYPIPQGGQVASYQIPSEFEVPRPRSVSLNGSVNEVKIQKLGDVSWILTSLAPSDSWPLVRNFLARESIPTSVANAELGTIETAWFSLVDDEKIINQFLISLSQGVQLNTTEIDIVHRSLNAEDVPDDLPKWTSKSDDIEKEHWFRDILASSLASEVSLGTASLSGREIGAAQKVSIVAPELSHPYIDMNLAFDRAWASVGYALDNDGFSITQSLFDERRYVVEYADKDAKRPSILSRLFSQENSLQAIVRGEGVESEKTSFQVVLEVQGEDRVIVRVYDADGMELSQRESYILLEIIRTNLT